LVRRLPGKEIWITEWHPGGGDPHNPRTYALTSPAMDAHGTARQMLAFLRHPEVTKTSFYTTNFEAPRYGWHLSLFVHAEDGSWKLDPEGLVLAWFAQAAKQGGSYQRLVEVHGTPIYGDPQWPDDSYLPIEGGEFTSGRRTVLILQNAGADDRRFDPTDGGRRPAPDRIDLLVTPNLNDEAKRAAAPSAVAPGAAFTLPALGIARITWDRNADSAR